MAHIIFCILGALGFFGGIVYYYYNFEKKFLPNKGNIDFVFFKKNIKELLIPIGVFLIGIISWIIATFNSDEVIANMADNSLTLSVGDGFLIYGFATLFVLMLGVFLTSLFFKLYLDIKEEDFNKGLKISLIFSIIFLICFFVIFTNVESKYLVFPLVNQIVISSKGVKLINSYSTAGRAYLSSISGFKIQIAFYAICILSGACLVLYICDHKMYRKYGSHGLLTPVFFVAVPAGIICARIWYCLVLEPARYLANPIEILYIWQGGLAIMGGAIGGILVGVIFVIIQKIKSAKYKPIDYLWMVDIIVPTILIAQGIGRIGNFFNNEVHGNSVDISGWFLLPDIIKNNMHYSSATTSLDSDHIYLPLFFIEAMVNFFGYFLIEYGIRKQFGIRIKGHEAGYYHPEGSCVGWYIAWYGMTRAILEPLRYGEFEYTSSWISAFCMIGGGLLIVIICSIMKYLNLKGKFKYQWQKYNEEMTK